MPSFPGDEEIDGCWLGPADNVRQAMCYWIIKENGKVMAGSQHCMSTDRWSYVMRVKQNNVLNLMRRYMKLLVALKTCHCWTTKTFRMMNQNLLIEDSEAVVDIELKCEVKENLVSGPDPFIGAKVYMPHGDRMEITKVLGHKHGPDGNYIGCAHANPILDSRQFTIEFLDGKQQDIAYNVLVEHLFSQVNKGGNQN
jgi:hypothetical protein